MKKDNISRFNTYCPKTTFVYTEGSEPSKGHSNYDGSKEGSQVALLQSNEVYGVKVGVNGWTGCRTLTWKPLFISCFQPTVSITFGPT